MNKLVDSLMNFGLTRQEANVYLYLYQNSQSTGYEIAKMTGISRSNVYNTLASLQEKGAIYSMEEGTSTKYVSVSIREFCENHFAHLQKDMDYLKQNIPILDRKEDDGYITIQGYINILDKLRIMIKQTEKRIYLSATYDIIRLYEKELITLCQDGKKVVLIANGDVEEYMLELKEILDIHENIEGCTIYRKQERDAQFMFVSDSSYVLTGELSGSQNDTCLYSSQENFVKFFKNALANEIQLIEIKRGM
jgi:sugar-specific transcriptional regulator TrmB